MTAVLLHAPAVHCAHCIATIRDAVEATEGARFVRGDEDAKLFVVDLARGEVLDALAANLEEAGYPLAEPPLEAVASAGGDDGAFAPSYRVERTGAGADVHYNCPCGSQDEVFHFDRSLGEQEPGSCCGHVVLVEPGAAERLRRTLGEGYAYDVQTVEMPWGQPMEAVMAVPAGRD